LEHRDLDPVSKHCLIVDNSEERSGILARMFEADGHRATTTWSGLEALRLLRSPGVDVVLVRTYVADLYVGEFLGRAKRLPSPPDVIVMQDSEECASTFRKIKERLKFTSPPRAALCTPHDK
jgi:CheY-like chemotaxis protein